MMVIIPGVSQSTIVNYNSIAIILTKKLCMGRSTLWLVLSLSVYKIGHWD